MGRDKAERRRYVRFTPSQPIPVRFEVVDAELEEGGDAVADAGSADSVNVSKGGMFLEVPRMSPELLEDLLAGKKMLSLLVEAPQLDRPLRALARVMWVEGASEGRESTYGVGVSFVKVSAEGEFNDFMIDNLLDE